MAFNPKINSTPNCENSAKQRYYSVLNYFLISLQNPQQKFFERKKSFVKFIILLFNFYEGDLFKEIKNYQKPNEKTL